MTWINPKSKAVALAIVRDSIENDDLNATLEACAVVTVLYARLVARDASCSSAELLSHLLVHAEEMTESEPELADAWKN